MELTPTLVIAAGKFRFLRAFRSGPPEWVEEALRHTLPPIRREIRNGVRDEIDQRLGDA